ncbi:MAG: hypothetical protein LBL58_08485 [Tannerellaceae bacterium]|jgi:hypothetical protein|nr:hypothetical protein [Tannerellaceae bacterium]
MEAMKTIEDVGACLIEFSKEMTEKAKRISEEYGKQFCLPAFRLTSIMPWYLISNTDVDRNLRQFMSIFSNNLTAGIYAESNMLRLMEEAKAANDKIKKEAARERAAFLFILLNGLEEQFKDVLNKHGVDDEDEVQNAIREFHNN